MITVVVCTTRLLRFWEKIKENMKIGFQLQALRYEILNRLKKKGGSNRENGWRGKLRLKLIAR
jgi:hypothetical protein